MMSDHHSPSRLVAIGRIAVGAALILALLLAAGTVFDVGAAPLADRGLERPCPTVSAPQATSISEVADQNSIGFGFTAATTGTTTLTTTVVPGRPGRSRQWCAPPRRDGTAQPSTGTALATPNSPQRPTRTADPDETPGTTPQPHDGPGRPHHDGHGEGAPPPRGPNHPHETAEPEQTEGTAPQATSQSTHPTPRPRPTSGSGYPGPGGS